jgi:hypothetical protein
VSPHADGVKVADTIDRASFVFDSSMGRSFYDSDIPDEEESEQWQQILAPQIGMTVEVTLDANHQITGCSGMKAIAAKIDSAATGGNMFWMYEKPRYTDERHQENWRNDVLSIFPNRTVQPGEAGRPAISNRSPSSRTSTSTARTPWRTSPGRTVARSP